MKINIAQACDRVVIRLDAEDIEIAFNVDGRASSCRVSHNGREMSGRKCEPADKKYWVVDVPND